MLDWKLHAAWSVNLQGGCQNIGAVNIRIRSKCLAIVFIMSNTSYCTMSIMFFFNDSKKTFKMELAVQPFVTQMIFRWQSHCLWNSVISYVLTKILKCSVTLCDGYLLLSGVFLCSCNIHSLCNLRASEDERWEWLSLRVEGLRLTFLNKGCWQRLKCRTWRPHIARLRAAVWAAVWTGLVCSGRL